MTALFSGCVEERDHRFARAHHLPGARWSVLPHRDTAGSAALYFVGHLASSVVAANAPLPWSIDPRRGEYQEQVDHNGVRRVPTPLKRLQKLDQVIDVLIAQANVKRLLVVLDDGPKVPEAAVVVESRAAQPRP